MHLDDVARGPRLLRHDRRRRAGERIQQARLAGVGRTGDAPRGSRRADARRAGRRDGARSRRAARRRHASALHRSVGGDVGLVGEVEPGLDQRLRLHQLVAPTLVERRSAPPSACASAWRRCASVSASMRSARPSTSVRSSLPFSKARRANSPGSASRSLEREQRIEHAPDHGAAAMHVQLGHVLAGEARRRREPERQPAVEQLAGSRDLDRAQGSPGAAAAAAAQRVAARRPPPAPRCGSPRRRPGRARSPARRWCRCWVMEFDAASLGFPVVDALF